MGDARGEPSRELEALVVAGGGWRRGEAGREAAGESGVSGGTTRIRRGLADIDLTRVAM